MQDQEFKHENEVLAMAPLNSEGDHNLFNKQSVQLTGAGSVQWDFILPDGSDWHFAQNIHHLKSDMQLNEFKQFIRYKITSIIAEHKS